MKLHLSLGLSFVAELGCLPVGLANKVFPSLSYWLEVAVTVLTYLTPSVVRKQLSFWSITFSKWSLKVPFLISNKLREIKPLEVPTLNEPFCSWPPLDSSFFPAYTVWMLLIHLPQTPPNVVTAIASSHTLKAPFEPLLGLLDSAV